jgi:hypothetical protein
MKSFILNKESKKFIFEYSDSPYSFNEDFDNTLESYCSITEIASTNLQTLLFFLHAKVAEILSDKRDNENILKRFDLQDYGFGPTYDDHVVYFLLSGIFNIEDISNENVTMKSKDGKIILSVEIGELDYFFLKDIEDLSIGDQIDFDGMDVLVFVADNQKENLLIKLHNDIDKLNNLILSMNPESQTIKIV